MFPVQNRVKARCCHPLRIDSHLVWWRPGSPARIALDPRLAYGTHVMTQIADKIPFTIITGFLGAGKTTLLSRLLAADHGHKLAVIINEFGEVNIDRHLIADQLGDGLLEMNNGCVCCTVQADLLDGLKNLLDQRREGLLHFDHIVMETTGLAKAGPIIQTLEAKALDKELILGGVITLVDAFHAPAQLDEFDEVQEQIGMADLIVLNKIDLVDDKVQAHLTQRLLNMNKGARVTPCQEADVDIAEVLELRSVFATDGDLPTNPAAAAHHHDHDHGHEHNHLDHVGSFVVRLSEPLDHGRALDWFSYLIMRYTEQLLRYKGILNIKGQSSRLVLQGVHALFEAKAAEEWRPGEKRKTELVFIGIDLPEREIRQGFEDCIA